MSRLDPPFRFFPFVTVTVTTGSSSSSSSTLMPSFSSRSSSPSVKLEGVTNPFVDVLRLEFAAETAGVDVAELSFVELAGVGREARAADRRGGMMWILKTRDRSTKLEIGRLLYWTGPLYIDALIALKWEKRGGEMIQSTHLLLIPPKSPLILSFRVERVRPIFGPCRRGWNEA